MKTRQKYLMGAAIFAAMLAIGFRTNGEHTTWLWQALPFVGILLMLIAFAVAALWVTEDRRSLKQAFELRLRQTETKENSLMQSLSMREKEVLNLIVQGKSNKQISEELFIAISTVKTHIYNIYKTLEVQDRQKLVETLKRADGNKSTL